MLGHPLNWTTDVATCLFAWACFLCADIAWRSNSLMAIELADRAGCRERASACCAWSNYAAHRAFLVYLIVMGT